MGKIAQVPVMKLVANMKADMVLVGSLLIFPPGPNLSSSQARSVNLGPGSSRGIKARPKKNKMQTQVRIMEQMPL